MEGKEKKKRKRKRKRRGNNGWDMRILQVLDQQDRRRGGRRRVRGLTEPDWEVVLVLPVWPRIMSSLLSLIRVVRVKTLARFGHGKRRPSPVGSSSHRWCLGALDRQIRVPERTKVQPFSYCRNFLHGRATESATTELRVRLKLKIWVQTSISLVLFCLARHNVNGSKQQLSEKSGYTMEHAG